MKSHHSDICVICGIRPVTSRDHIPPRSIFPKPPPGDLITVPACDNCNNMSSGLDEEFKVAIGIQAGHGEEGERLFFDQTRKTIAHNQRLKKELARSMRWVELQSLEGLFVGTAMAVLLNSQSYDTVINRIIRGLHWHHTGDILGDRVDIKVRWHRNLSRKIYEMTTNWSTGIVGKGQFIYKYFVCDEIPMASIWVLQFFRCAWSSGTVMPKG